MKKLMMFFCVLAALQGAEETKKPNIVFIMTDDVGWGDLGSYGG